MSDFGTPYWWEDGVPLPDLPNTLSAKTELLIVGAGYTGLSAALTAVEAGMNVTVVDAGVPGQGASTRNGGMAGAHPRLSLAAMSEKYGIETAHGMFNEATPAFDYLQNLIKTYKIDCDYQHTGRIQLAWTRAQFEAQKAMAADMNAHTDFPVEVIERENLHHHVKTDYYFGGLFYRDHGALHPRKFHDGLMRAALDRGVHIIQNCPVGDMTPDGIGFQVITPNGTVTADKVLLATNGYTQGNGPLRWLTRRVFPLPSYIIATEPLSDNLIQTLAPGRRMMVETRARHSYWRVSPDGTRIIWGGRSAIRQINVEQSTKRLHKTMCDIWPELKGVNITHAWKGNTGFTFNHSPHVGVMNGIHFALGYSGGGVVLAPYLGMKAAYQVMGDPRGETAYSNTPFATKPYFWGRHPWFLSVADRWYSMVTDTMETRTARRDKETWN